MLRQRPPITRRKKITSTLVRFTHNACLFPSPLLLYRRRQGACNLAERVYPSGIPTMPVYIYRRPYVRALIVLCEWVQDRVALFSFFHHRSIFDSSDFCMPDRQRGAQRPPFHAKRRRHACVWCGSRSGETSVQGATLIVF